MRGHREAQPAAGSQRPAASGVQPAACSQRRAASGEYIVFGVGDLGETLVAMTVRAEIKYKSDLIGTMPEECKFKEGGLDQPLTKKLEAGTGDLPVYVAYVQLSMREDIVFQSAELMTLPPGSEFKVIEKALRTV